MQYYTNVAHSLSLSLFSVSVMLRQTVERLDGGFVAVCIIPNVSVSIWTHHRKTEDLIWYGYACRAALIKEGDIVVMPTSRLREHLCCRYKRAWWSWIADLSVSSLKPNPSRLDTADVSMLCMDVKTSSDAFLLSLTLYGDVNKCH